MHSPNFPPIQYLSVAIVVSPACTAVSLFHKVVTYLLQRGSTVRGTFDFRVIGDLQSVQDEGIPCLPPIPRTW